MPEASKPFSLIFPLFPPSWLKEGGGGGNNAVEVGEVKGDNGRKNWTPVGQDYPQATGLKEREWRMGASGTLQ